jgi:chaperone required for assembly of F1-ATPase
MSENKPSDPRTAARRLAKPERPKRFYKTAAVGPGETGFAVLLDGRPLRTPARRPMIVDDAAVAEALAREWDAQVEVIEPATMPLTRIVNTAIDRVSGEMEAVRADIVAYASSDLICYRADGPDSLVEAENALWTPLLDWAREELGARLILAEGIVHVAQDEEALASIGEAVRPFDALGLAALHVATTLTGSAIVALALARGRLSVDEAWAAAHVDEDWQMIQWGRDEAAFARRAGRFAELQAAALILESGQ